jgi:hypothetical protein
MQPALVHAACPRRPPETVETGPSQANCACSAAYKGQQKGHTAADRLPHSAFASGQALEPAPCSTPPTARSLPAFPFTAHALGLLNVNSTSTPRPGDAMRDDALCRCCFCPASRPHQTSAREVRCAAMSAYAPAKHRTTAPLGAR